MLRPRRLLPHTACSNQTLLRLQKLLSTSSRECRLRCLGTPLVGQYGPHFSAYRECCVCILVVENNSKLAKELTTALRKEQFEAVVERTGERALRRLEEQRFALTILGLPLCDTHVFEMLRVTQQRSPDTRVLILSPDLDLDVRITILNAGADDYQVKPYALAEVVFEHFFAEPVKSPD